MFRIYDGRLEQDHVVAYWDQRGAGRSFDASADPGELTVANHLSDLRKVVAWLRNRFHGRKVVLLGHSWGSALGLLYARDHPEDIAAVIAVNPFVSGKLAEQGQYRFVEAQAIAQKDDFTLNSLHSIGPPPFAPDEILQVQSLVDLFGGLYHIHPSYVLATMQALLGGYVSPMEIHRFIEGNTLSLRAMHDELYRLDMRQSVGKLAVPVTFMLGCYDHQLDANLSEQYFDMLDAPEKSLVWFTRSAHNIPFEEPGKFVTSVSRSITRPELPADAGATVRDTETASCSD